MKDILKVENVTKIYGKKTVLDNVSFSIKEGEIFPKTIHSKSIFKEHN